MVKLQHQNNQYFVTIPLDIILKKKWKKGKRLIVRLNSSDNVFIEEIEEE